MENFWIFKKGRKNLFKKREKKERSRERSMRSFLCNRNSTSHYRILKNLWRVTNTIIVRQFSQHIPRAKVSKTSFSTIVTSLVQTETGGANMKGKDYKILSNLRSISSFSICDICFAIVRLS